MDSFPRKLLTEWRKLGLPFADERIVVGVSGGADSVSLLLALSDLTNRTKIANEIVVAHFEHGLRGDQGPSDARFVEALSTKLGLRFVVSRAVGRFEVAKSGNLEQNARRARYRFLAEIAESLGAFAVCTAHTLNDQAETFLLNLIRGSGTAGLSAMRPVIDEFRIDENSDRGVRLIRPLLTWAMRRDTEAFCGETGEEFVNDAMNDDLAFSRVRVRKELIPLLETFNPRIVETLARNSELLRNTAEPAPMNVDEPLIADLKGLPRAQLLEYLRQWVNRERGNLRGIGLKTHRRDRTFNLGFKKRQDR
ncbi:MAG: tRNA lysidine(34) synthetase TilS [Acidobacteria bacterium]|nr:tRNA lysidine(34) synthetase TilS [Acidobacteriota bacterium]